MWVSFYFPMSVFDPKFHHAVIGNPTGQRELLAQRPLWCCCVYGSFLFCVPLLK